MRLPVALVILMVSLAACAEAPQDEAGATDGAAGRGQDADLGAPGGDAADDGPATGDDAPGGGDAQGEDDPAGGPAAAPEAEQAMWRALHEDTWLCQEPEEVTDLEEGTSLTCSVSLSFTDTHVIVTTTGIPNHHLESGPSPEKAREQQTTWRIPLVPTMAGTPTMAPDRGAIAAAVNGAAIYGPEEGSGGAAVANQYGYYDETRENVELGVCDGHSGPGGEYHYHADANCVHWHDGVYAWEQVPSDEHSGIIGFALDGFPIYGSYGWDDHGAAVEITSSYRFKTASEGGENGWNGMDDFVHEEGLGDLDACNGRFAATPEFPHGVYAYHSTRHNGDGELGFPHFLVCYAGVVEDVATGPGGDPPPQGSPPPEGSPSPNGSGGEPCRGPDGEEIPPRPDGSCPDGPPGGPP